MRSYYYLAGPMRGHPRHNFDVFAKWAKRLRDQGVRIISPAEMDLEVGFDPGLSYEQQPNHPMRDAVVRDVSALAHPACDGIILLSGWELSKGAVAEYYVTQWLGKEVLVIREGPTDTAWTLQNVDGDVILVGK